MRVKSDEAIIRRTQQNQDIMLLKPCWKAKKITEGAFNIHYDKRYVILCGFDDVDNNVLKQLLEGVDDYIIEKNEETKIEMFEIYYTEVFEFVQNILKSNKTETILIQAIVSNDMEHKFYTAIGGMLKTANLENPQILGQLIEIEVTSQLNEIVRNLNENSYCPNDQHIYYENGKRYVASWFELEAKDEDMNIPWDEKGIYVITGGLGGLGLIFTQEITKWSNQGTIILVGRSQLSKDNQQNLIKLQRNNNQIIYMQADITDYYSTECLIEDITSKYGHLNGIIHNAAVIDDNFIINKKNEQFKQVMAPKVSGLLNLDKATKDIELDFFMISSSIAGCLGNIGQADYATANFFMDLYADYRNKLVHDNSRYGQTISINWSHWKCGGMHIQKEIEELINRNTGMMGLETESGINALYKIFGLNDSRVMVMQGDKEKIKMYLNLDHTGINEDVSNMNYGDCLRLTEKILKNELTEEELSEILRLNHKKYVV